MKKPFLLFDWYLIVPIIFLVLISLNILFSINPLFLRNQLFALSVSIVAFFIFSQIAYTDFRSFSLPLYISAVVLLIVVYILGFESRGAVRWLDIFGVSLQASEIAKPILTLAFAGFLAGRSGNSFKLLLTTLFFLLPVFVLIYLQPDLGNALVFVIVLVLSLLVFGVPIKWFVLGSLPFIVSAPSIWYRIHDYQRLRVLTFFNPLRDPDGSSYNLIQAIIAVGSGGVFGKGITEGTQSRLNFLPENHTDFIFASLAEKLGFVGSLFVVLLFVFIFFRIYQIFSRTKDIYGQMIVSCAFFFLLVQFFVNIGMNLGLVPIVGLTLPFVSYGGSSLLACFILVGILSSVSTRNRENSLIEIK